MVHRVATDIEIPFYCWKKLKPVKEVQSNVAFDTETINGGVFLINDSDNRYMDVEGSDDLYSLLSYLMYKPYRKTVNWFYNLEYDTNAILRHLSFEKRRQIAFNNTVEFEDFKIEIIPKKELRIGKVGTNEKMQHTVAFYDLAQFYEMIPLKKLAEQTNYSKVEVEDIQHINYVKYQNDIDYQNLIRDRCLIDCKITKELADKFTNKINPIVKINKYKSKASIARRYVLENLQTSLKIPSIALIQSALNSYHAGHIEACKLGIFKNIRNYDLNSAYPSYTADLYDSTGVFKHNREYEPDTAYSFYHLSVNYHDDNLTPIWINSKSKNYHPNGDVDIWITQPEIEFFMEKGFNYQIISAYHLLKRKNHETPFHELIHDLYNKRLEAKKDNDPIQLTYKIILASIYGVSINAVSKREISEVETKDFSINEHGDIVFYNQTFKAGNMYNPLFAAYITAQTRIRLFRDFYKHLDKLVSINTDGVYLTAGNGVTVSKKLGDYSFKKIDKLMVMGSGRYFYYNEDGSINNKESAFRSIPKSPTDILQMMKDSRNNDKLSISRDKPIKLKESIKIGKYKDKFNEFHKVTKNVSFKLDRRHWFDQFNTIDDIFNKQIESRPYNVEELANIR